MSKRFLVLLVIAAFAIGIYLLSPFISYTMGRTAFDKKQYHDAAKFYRFSILMRPDNLKFKSQYLRNLFQLPQTTAVQKEIYEIAKQSSNGVVATAANKRLDLIKENTISKLGTTYIDRVPYGTAVIRWNADKFPLAIFFDASTVEYQNYRQAIEQAFNAWERESYNFLSFRKTTSESDADIVVSISNSLDSPCDGNNTQCLYSVGNTEPEINSDKLKKMRITFRAKDNNGNLFENQKIYATALHEIGHALGIMGHTDMPDSIMNATLNSGSISQADVNTLILLYALAPDISNYDEDMMYSDFVYAPIVMGNIIDVAADKIAEAKAYIRNAPHLSYGYIDLASSYYSLNQYHDALMFLNTALDKARTNAEKVNIYYNYAAVYLKLQNYIEAMNYIEKAMELGDKTPQALALYSEILYKSDKKEEAIKTMKKAVAQEPQSIDYSYMLASMYLDKRDYLSASRVLNALIKNNANAKQDDRIKKYAFLTIF